MKRNNELEKIAAISNSILLICVTVLFIVFKQPWPALLLLLWTTIEYDDEVK